MKARSNEPCHIRQVAEAVAQIRGVAVGEIESAVYENTVRLFPDTLRCVEFWKRGDSG